MVVEESESNSMLEIVSNKNVSMISVIVSELRRARNTWRLDYIVML